MIFSVKVSQNFIVYQSPEDRNLRAFFNRVKNSLSCNIFTKYYCNWDALLTCQRRTCFLEPSFFPPEGFENGIIQTFLTGYYMAWGSISLFAGFLEKENSLETLIVIFEKVSPKRFFLTEYEEFRNLCSDCKFSIFCRQPLLRINVTEDYFLGVQIRLSTRCKICFTLKSPSFSLKSHTNEPLS